MASFQNVPTVVMAAIGVTSSCTYCVQAVVQIKRHGFKTWLEAGFNQLEKVAEEVAGEIEEELVKEEAS